MVGHIHVFVPVGTWEGGSEDNGSRQATENVEVELDVFLFVGPVKSYT